MQVKFTTVAPDGQVQMLFVITAPAGQTHTFPVNTDPSGQVQMPATICEKVGQIQLPLIIVEPKIVQMQVLPTRVAPVGQTQVEFPDNCIPTKQHILVFVTFPEIHLQLLLILTNPCPQQR